jgi:hypothetical protein
MTVIGGSPAQGHLQQGDELIAVQNVTLLNQSGLPAGDKVINEIAKVLPGTTIALLVERNGSQLLLHLTLGSRSDPAYSALPDGSSLVQV